MNILLYLLILVLGAIIGYKNILSNFFMEKIEDIQTYALLLLLFIMGINIGIDQDVIKYFGVIGYQSIVLATFSIVFSILAVKLVTGKVLKGKEGIKNDG
ncbi:LysO family transporter [Natronincola ferrireducens]|uniref:Lysine exporter LysO n=1 Tax=Natronincola ferrireducens TaxID=393762 RepID=A0A1G9CNA8_9FIRM|nr:LysO family transporter [Natronincola ferrireducens]SDK53069.1 Membrane protein of unknown function [Natronincola ferrireducens]